MTTIGTEPLVAVVLRLAREYLSALLANCCYAYVATVRLALFADTPITYVVLILRSGN